MCLTISGIPGDTGDFSEDIELRVLDHAGKKGLELSSSDIDKCHVK